MKRLFTLILILFTIISFAQESDEKGPENAVKTFFKGFHASDEAMIKSVVHENLTMQSIYQNKQGETKLNQGNAQEFIQAVVERAKKEQWTEKISSYETRIDGVMATVWTPYRFHLGDQFIHCGVNAFTLIKGTDGVWRILSIIDTRRKATCD